MSPRLWAVIPAAGVGRRMGADIPKQYLPLRGRPVLHWALDALLAEPRVEGGVIALSTDDRLWEERPYRHPKPLHRVAGGAERCDSVLNALRYLVEQAEAAEDWVLVHDAVRPWVAPTELERLISAGLASADGALLAAPVRDTLKRQDAAGRVAETVDRAGVWHALTPQLFPLRALYRALAAALEHGAQVTDEASAMERAGRRPLLVEGSAANLKITRPSDLWLAEAILSKEPVDADRSGL